MPDFKPKNFSPWLSQYTVTEPRVVFHDSEFNSQTSATKSIQSLSISYAHMHHLRNGELGYQAGPCRLKLLVVIFVKKSITRTRNISKEVESEAELKVELTNYKPTWMYLRWAQ